jgi:hypothetical protein
MGLMNLLFLSCGLTDMRRKRILRWLCVEHEHFNQPSANGSPKVPLGGGSRLAEERERSLL